MFTRISVYILFYVPTASGVYDTSYLFESIFVKTQDIKLSSGPKRNLFVFILIHNSLFKLTLS